MLLSKLSDERMRTTEPVFYAGLLAVREAEPLLHHPAPVELREVALAGVGEEGDDEGVGGEALGDAAGAGGGGAARGAGEDRLLPGELEDGVIGGRIVDLDDLVDRVPPDGRGH